jgi:hypothetical protein
MARAARSEEYDGTPSVSMKRFLVSALLLVTLGANPPAQPPPVLAGSATSAKTPELVLVGFPTEAKTPQLVLVSFSTEAATPPLTLAGYPTTANTDPLVLEAKKPATGGKQ